MIFTITTEKGSKIELDSELVESFVIGTDEEKYEITIKKQQNG